MPYNSLKNVTFRPLKSDDFEIIFTLCEERFGKGYLTRKEFDGWLSYPELCLAAEYNGSFAGFLCFLPVSVAELALYMKLDPDYITTASRGKPVAHFKTAILKTEYEHRGLIHTMAELVMGRLREMGIGAIFGPAWKYDGYIPMKKPLLALGFEEVGERKNIWYDMEDYTCIVCGGRCKCDSIIYKKCFGEDTDD